MKSKEVITIPCEFHEDGVITIALSQIDAEAQSSAISDLWYAKGQYRARISPHLEKVKTDLASNDSDLQLKANEIIETQDAIERCRESSKLKGGEKEKATWRDYTAIGGNIGAILAITTFGTSQIVNRLAESGGKFATLIKLQPEQVWLYGFGIIAGGTISAGMAFKLLPHRETQRKVALWMFSVAALGLAFTILTTSIDSVRSGDSALQATTYNAPQVSHDSGAFLSFFRNDAPYFVLFAAAISEIGFAALFKLLILWRIEGKRWSHSVSTEEKALRQKLADLMSEQAALQDERGDHLTKRDAIKNFRSVFLRDVKGAISERREVIATRARKNAELKKIYEQRIKDLRKGGASEE